MMSQFTINEKNFTRFSKRLQKLFEEKTHGQILGYLEAQEFLSQIFGVKDLHEFKKLIQNQHNSLDTKKEENVASIFSSDDADVFDPFAVNNASHNYVATIAKPMDSNISVLDTHPYKKYNYINEAWHTPSHGINIENKKALTLFFKDLDKSSTMWQESGVYLGFILQAVQEDTVIDTGVPIGLYSEANSDIEEKNIHIKSEMTRELIENYKKYLISEVHVNFDNTNIEIKPFYAINDATINYELVEQNWNKRLKIK